MWFRSMMSRLKSVRTIVVLAAIAAGLVAGSSGASLASGSEPSPFAGEYGCSSFLDISISDTGRIDGYQQEFFVERRIRGSISLTGAMTLNLLEIRYSPDPGSRPSRLRYTVTGLGDLDEEGNLQGLLEFDDGGLWPFFWPRCD